MRIAILMCVVVGCGGGNDKEPPKPIPEPVGSARPPEPTPKPADAYQTHLAAGRHVEVDHKWTEALTEYELALEAKPGDATALGEIGAAAFYAGKPARARQASELAIEAAGTDKRLRAAALYNLGRAIEKASPNAAASLYAASNAESPRARVKARIATIVAVDPVRVRQTTRDGDELLAKFHVAPIKLPTLRKAATPLDRKLFDALDAAGVEFEGAAGKAVAVVENLECSDFSVERKTHRYECTNPRGVSEATAKVIVENLIARKIPGEKTGDRTTYSVGKIRCATYDVESIDNQIPADSCEVN